MCHVLSGNPHPPSVGLSFLTWKRGAASLFLLLVYAAGSRGAVNAHALPQLKSAQQGIIWVLSIRSLYPLRSGSFLWSSVRSDHHWRARICCELDDSWVCIFFGWSVAWILNGLSARPLF